jgi:cell shape-determining protein MreD
MNILISIPIMLLLLILQTTVGGEVRLLNGVADLLLVWLSAWGLLSKDASGFFLAFLAGGLSSYVSALPWYVYPLAYLSAIFMAHFISRKLWQSPLLSMFAVILVSSILLNLFTLMGLRLNGLAYPWQDSLQTVIIPSVFLNLLVSIPVFAIVRDFAGWLYPSEEVE